MDKSKKMLIVDDALINRRILSRIFSNDYEILEAENGEVALKLIKLYSEQLSIVLLDIHMPILNGFEVLKEINKSERLSGLPIIAITGENASEIEALNAGAWDFIKKPFNVDVIKKRVDNAINKHLLASLIAQRDEQERYEIITKQSGTIVFEYNVIKDQYFASDNFKEFVLGKSPLKKIFYNKGNFNAIHKDDISKLQNEFFAKLKAKEKYVETTIRMLKINGKFVWCKLSANCDFDDDGNLVRAIGTIKDVNNEIEYLNQLKRDAQFDSTTGVYNKITFLRSTRNLIQSNDIEYAIIRYDIYHFKVINELFGHDEGDELLIYIAANIQKILSKLDNATFGRLEADVFGICIEKQYINKIVSKLEQITEKYDLNYDIISNIGIYIITDKNMQIEVMCDRAKLATESIKGKYLIKHAYFDEKLHQNIIREQEIINMMNSAIENNEFKVYLQPKYDLSTNTICGAEALVRWINDKKGMIFPNDFIPVFERNGFIMKLDVYIWEQVCILLRKHIDSGMPVFPISVNISIINIYNPLLCDTIIGLVEKYNIPTNLFELELTESAYADNKMLLDSIMSKLQGYGFTMMMDDFGSGYSSLNMLKDIPVDVLKIDLKFLSSDSDSGKGGSILASIMRMARWINLRVITEGVETKQQADFLRSIGCTKAQGYYFAKPMPTSEYEKLIIENAPKVEDKINQSIETSNINEIWDPNSKLSLLFDSLVSAIGIYEINQGNLEAVRLSDKYFDMIDTTRQDFFDESIKIMDWVVDEDKQIVKNMFDQAFETKANAEAFYRRRKPSGKTLWLHSKIRYIAGDENYSVYFAVINDVTSEKNYELQLQQTNQQLQSVYQQLELRYSHEKQIRETVASNSIAFFEIDLTDNVLIGDEKNTLKMLGLSKGVKYDEFLSKVLDIGVNKDDIEKLRKIAKRENLLRNYNNNKFEFRCEYRAKRLNGEYYWVDGVFSLFRSKENEHIFCTWTGKDINGQKKYEEMLIEKAEKDALTNLYNGVSFTAIVTKELEKKDCGTFFMLDIDDFKQINDNFGHMCGNEILKSTANILNSVFSTNALVSRMGGDEFAVFIGKNLSNSQIEKYGKQLLAEINKLTIENKHRVLCSVGVAIYDSECTNYNNLYSNADKALYYSKRDGKNKLSIYEQKHRSEKSKILIADDVEVHRAILTELLSNKYDIIEAYDGIDAYEKLKSHQNNISLAIIDNKMPRRTGLELMKDIKSSLEFSRLPIIMTTMYSEPEIKLQALDLGALYFIDKPFDSEMVKKLVDNVINATKIK